MTTPTFTAMDHSTKEEWDRIAHESVVDWSNTPDRILAMLRDLAAITNGFAVDQLTHVLQTATRAERAGADARSSPRRSATTSPRRCRSRTTRPSRRRC